MHLKVYPTILELIMNDQYVSSSIIITRLYINTETNLVLIKMNKDPQTEANDRK